MADHLDDADTSEGSDRLIDHMAEIEARFSDEDLAAAAREDGMDEDEGEDEGQGSDDGESDDDTEHTDTDTSSRGRDGADDDSENDSGTSDDAKDDDDDDDDQGTESDDDDGDGAAKTGKTEGEDDEGDDDVSPDTRRALERHGADLKLEDVPEKYRPMIEKKIKAADTAFTRTMQELSTFRKEQTEYRASRAYEEKHPELLIVELMRKGGEELLNKVNSRWAQLHADEETGVTAEAAQDYNRALDVTIADTKSKIKESIDTEFKTYEAQMERAAAVAQLGESEAKAAGIPWGTSLQKAIASAVTKDAAGNPVIEDATVKAIVAEFAKDFTPVQRKNARDESRQKVKDKNARRSKPATVRSAAGSSSSTIGKKPEPAYDDDDREQRISRMMGTARRLIPGARPE